MAQIETWLNQDLLNPVKVRYIDGNFFSQDNAGNLIGINLTRDGMNYSGGGSVSANVIRADGATVAVTGALSGNVATVVLPQSAYAVVGILSIVIKLTVNSEVTTIGAVVGNVYQSSTDTAVDPGTVIPDIDTLVAEIEAAVASIPADYSDLWASVAPNFIANKNYYAGQFVTYNGKVYQFTKNHAAGSWSSNGVWEVSLGQRTGDEIIMINKFVDDFAANAAKIAVSTNGTTGKYWNCETDVAVLTDISTSSGFHAFDAVSVAVGEVYTMYGNVGTTHKAMPWLVTDDNLNIIAFPGDRANISSMNYTIVIPNGGTKLLITTTGVSDPQLKKISWLDTIDTSKSLKYGASIQYLGYTTLAQCVKTGWYGCGSAYTPTLSDLPDGFDISRAITLFVFEYAFNSGSQSTDVNSIALQILINTVGQVYQRLVYMISGTVGDWVKLSGGVGYSDFIGKTIAIVGDSISTNGNSGTYANVPEIQITEDDVGVELSAYITYYDVQNELSINGYTFQNSDIGVEKTFTPAAADVGKKVGLPANYNSASTNVWWEVAMSQLGFTPIPVCWSGASITSHEGNTSEYKTSYAWHPAQIRKCGIRTPGSMTRTAPDVIIIYRGVNDFSHSPYAKLTDDYFANYNWQYPTDDTITGGYGFKEGYCLTIKKLRETYPNAKIFLCTLNVFKRINYSHFPTNNGTDSLPEYNDAIREIADFMGCDVLSFDRDGITFENCYSGGYLNESTNSTHPTNKGHKAIGLKAIADLTAKYSPMG